MVKSDPEVLSREVTNELITYLRDGTINADGLAQTFEFTGIDIEDFDQLKQLHFVLHDDVFEYVRKLQQRLRRIKTEQRRQREVSRGEVRGSINWGQTFAQRTKIGYEDRTLFVVEDPTVELDISENRIVKKLLGRIEAPLTDMVENKYHGWRGEWTDDDIIALQQTLRHNVHLNELPDAVDIDVTDRDVSTARRSRHELYTEGARLYQMYDDLMNNRFDRAEVSEFLRDTIVSPERDFRVFELFCLFGVIKAINAGELNLLDVEPGTLKLQTMHTGDHAVAKLEGEDIVVRVYHDTIGSLEFFEKYPEADELSDEVPDAIVRHARALEHHAEAVDAFIGRGDRHSFFSGRPDIVVVKRRNRPWGQPIEQVLIGEVKYTESPSTFATGLRELIEYIHLAREERSDGWLYEDELPSDAVRGVVCTDGVDTKVPSYDIVSHLSTEDFREISRESVDDVSKTANSAITER